LKELEDKIPIANVDCDEHKDLCSAEEIRGYPTLKLFKNGQAFDYDGPRAAKGIVDYIKR
jgi:thioredoxin-like negative regulator of GroEL